MNKNDMTLWFSINDSSCSDVFHAAEFLESLFVAFDVFRKRDRDPILGLVQSNGLWHPLELLSPVKDVLLAGQVPDRQKDESEEDGASNANQNDQNKTTKMQTRIIRTRLEKCFEIIFGRITYTV